MLDHAADSCLWLTIDLDQPGRCVVDLMLRWSDNTNPLGYHPIPTINIKGGAGPAVFVIGGTHGDEFEGPAAIMQLACCLSPAALSGQVVLMPTLNVSALAGSSRVSLLGGANLNRAFSGGGDGSSITTLAHFIEAVLMPRFDAVSNLYYGGMAAFFQPCALATRSADPIPYGHKLALAEALGLPQIWVLGKSNDSWSVDAAEHVGVPGIATELSCVGASNAANIERVEIGLLQCLDHLGPIDASSVSNALPRRVESASPLDSVHAPTDGYCDRAVCAWEAVSAGQMAGRVHRPPEPERQSLLLSFLSDRLVLAHISSGMVRRGELLALVARYVPEGQ